MKSLSLFCVVWLSLNRLGHSDDTFLCTDLFTFCTLQGLELVSDPEEYCEDAVPYDNTEPCNCGVLCLKYLEKGDECTTTFTIGVSDSICGSGLDCLRENVSDFTSTKRCTPNLEKTCVREYVDYETDEAAGSVGVGRRKPHCDEFGDFDSVQCTPGQTCYCSDKNGDRLWGEDIESNFDEMNCDCARYWARVSVVGLGGGMRCLPNGNFDALQCFEDVCYCYDEKEKEITVGPFSLSTAIQMECFDPDIHSINFTNPCNEELAKVQALAHLEDPNLILISETPPPKCTPDGYYGPIQTRQNVTLCTDYLGNKIEDFQSPNYLKDEMNCYCARRRAIMTAAGVTTNFPVCCQNGNFNPIQSRGLYSYCVDVNGNQDGEEVLAQKEDTLDCSLPKCREDA